MTGASKKLHQGPAARRANLQGPARRADHPAARRPGLRRRRARRPRPRRRHPGRPQTPVRHLRGHRVSDRLREGVPRRRPVLPLAAPERASQGRGRLAAAPAFHRAAGAAQPPLRRCLHLRPAHPPGPARRQGHLPAAAPQRMDLLHPRRPPRIHHPGPSTTPTSPNSPPTPPRTAATVPPGRPAKARRCWRASSSAAAAATG